MGVTLHTALPTAIDLGLGKGIQEFANLLGARAYPIKNSKISFLTRKSIAQYLDKDVRTISRYVNRLMERGFILSRDVQKGPQGTMFLEVNTQMLVFESGENPYTGRGMTATEFKEAYYAKSDSPKREYIPETPEERALRRKRRSQYDILNEQLQGLDFPTRDFFKQLEGSGRYYQAYLLSRMYNAYRVIIPEYLKREAVQRGDLKAAEYLQRVQDTYAERDILSHCFLGTSNFTNFLKLRDLLYANDIDPDEYLSVQFQYSVYLYKSRTNRLKFPYQNTLYGREAYERYANDLDFHNNQARKHPYYYQVDGQHIKTVGASEPIMRALTTAYKDIYRRGNDYFKQLTDYYDDPFRASLGTNRFQMVLGHYKSVKKASEGVELTDEERESLENYLRQQLITHISKKEVLSHIYLTVHAPSLYKYIEDHKELPVEERNARVGNTSKFRGQVTDEELSIVRADGYSLELSLMGNVSFYNVLRTISDVQKTLTKPDILGSAMEKVGAEKFAVNKYGMLDMQALYDKYATPESMRQDSEYSTSVKFFEEDPKTLDSERFPWYTPMCRYLSKRGQ